MLFTQPTVRHFTNQRNILYSIKKLEQCVVLFYNIVANFGIVKRTTLVVKRKMLSEQIL